MSLFPAHRSLADLIAGRSDRINWKRNLAIIWLGQLLSMCGTGFAFPFIPLYIRDKFGIADEVQRGVYVAAFQFFGMISFCFSSPIWGTLGDRYGRKLMLLRAYFLNGVTMPLLMAAPNVYWLIFLRFVVSCFSGTNSAAQALVVSTTPKEKHGFALGMLSAAFWSGDVLGLLGGGLVVHYWGYTAAFFVCGALFILGGFLMLFGVSENFTPPIKNLLGGTKKTPLSEFFTPGLLLLLVLLAAVSLARRFDAPFVPMLVEQIDGVERAVLQTGYISALAAVGGILSGLVIGSLTDRFPAWTLTLPMLLAAALSTFVEGASTSIVMLAVARFLTYFAVGAIEPVLLTTISRITSPAHRGAALGWSASVRILGGVLGAGVSGLIVAHFRTRGVFFAAAIVMLALAPISVALFRSRFILSRLPAKQE